MEIPYELENETTDTLLNLSETIGEIYSGVFQIVLKASEFKKIFEKRNQNYVNKRELQPPYYNMKDTEKYDNMLKELARNSYALFYYVESVLIINPTYKSHRTLLSGKTTSFKTEKKKIGTSQLSKKKNLNIFDKKDEPRDIKAKPLVTELYNYWLDVFQFFFRMYYTKRKYEKRVYKKFSKLDTLKTLKYDEITFLSDFIENADQVENWLKIILKPFLNTNFELFKAIHKKPGNKIQELKSWIRRHENYDNPGGNTSRLVLDEESSEESDKELEEFEEYEKEFKGYEEEESTRKIGGGEESDTEQDNYDSEGSEDDDEDEAMNEDEEVENDEQDLYLEYLNDENIDAIGQFFVELFECGDNKVEPPNDSLKSIVNFYKILMWLKKEPICENFNDSNLFMPTLNEENVVLHKNPEVFFRHLENTSYLRVHQTLFEPNFWYMFSSNPPTLYTDNDMKEFMTNPDEEMGFSSDEISGILKAFQHFFVDVVRHFHAIEKIVYEHKEKTFHSVELMKYCKSFTETTSKRLLEEFAKKMSTVTNFIAFNKPYTLKPSVLIENFEKKYPQNNVPWQVFSDVKSLDLDSLKFFTKTTDENGNLTYTLNFLYPDNRINGLIKQYISSYVKGRRGAINRGFDVKIDPKAEKESTSSDEKLVKRDRTKKNRQIKNISEGFQKFVVYFFYILVEEILAQLNENTVDKIMTVVPYFAKWDSEEFITTKTYAYEKYKLEEKAYIVWQNLRLYERMQPQKDELGNIIKSEYEEFVKERDNLKNKIADAEEEWINVDDKIKKLIKKIEKAKKSSDYNAKRLVADMTREKDYLQKLSFEKERLFESMQQRVEYLEADIAKYNEVNANYEGYKGLFQKYCKDLEALEAKHMHTKETLKQQGLLQEIDFSFKEFHQNQPKQDTESQQAVYVL